MEEHAGAQPGSGAEPVCAAVPGVGDEQKNDLSLADSAASCTTRANRVPGANGNANANANAERADVSEMMEPETEVAQVKAEPGRTEDREKEEEEQAPNKEDRQPVNKPSTDEPSVGITDVLHESSKRPEPNTAGLETNAAKAKSTEGSNGGSLSEGLPSLDSLESFSNLNSCPSSDPVSETLEDQEKAPPGAQQGDEGAKGPSSKERCGPVQSVYHIKWIKWKEENTPIITQNENGPCPLLAIMNVLLLAWKVGMLLL